MKSFMSISVKEGEFIKKNKARIHVIRFDESETIYSCTGGETKFPKEDGWKWFNLNSVFAFVYPLKHNLKECILLVSI